MIGMEYMMIGMRILCWNDIVVMPRSCSHAAVTQQHTARDTQRHKETHRDRKVTHVRVVGHEDYDLHAEIIAEAESWY